MKHQPPLTQDQVTAAVHRAVARAEGREEIKKIAALDDLEYEREREPRAKAMGVRVGALDRLRKRERAEKDDSALPPRLTVPPCSNPCERCSAATWLCRRVPTPRLRSGSCTRGR